MHQSRGSAQFQKPQVISHNTYNHYNTPTPADTSLTPTAPTPPPIDISRIVKYAPAELIGREAETSLLNDAWDKATSNTSQRPHVLTFVALGGEGKTSLVAKWAADLAHNGWPGCEAAFAWSFYSQGARDQLAVSSDVFLAEALTFFGDSAMANSPAGAFDKAKRLAQLAGQRRALLILDGLEPLQYPPTSPLPGELKDQGIGALLKCLAAESRGLCVVTTRYALPDLRAFMGKTVHEIPLTRLSTPAGVHLLQTLGVRKESGAAREFEKLVEDVHGHALTLNLLGTYLRDAHAGDIRQRDRVKLAEADAEEQGGHAFRVMDAYVQAFEIGGKTATADEGANGQRALALLRLLGLFDRPATADCLNALWQGEPVIGLTEPLVGLTEAQRNLALKRLEDARLLTVTRDAAGGLIALDAHPLLREYFARRLQSQQPDAWRDAHRRLYEHLCASTHEGDAPTLEDLQPLYQAVAHGCHAGLQQGTRDGVYFARIARRNEHYSSKRLGAFGSDLGAVGCFFEVPWSHVSSALTEATKAWLLNEAATRLRALGRLTEALEPMRAALKTDVKQERWSEAAVSATNLSELVLTLGEVVEAARYAEQSVTYADRSGAVFHRVSKRATHADALHQASRLAEAETRFREAERMQAEFQPGYPLLYSLQGFQYCDLLLAQAERAVWGVASGESGESGVGRGELIEACHAVSKRAALTLKWMLAYSGASLLDIALDHLTLGRAALYAALLEGSDFRQLSTDFARVDDAVSNLRRAGQQQYLPLGLLTRAWLHSVQGKASDAKADLDEAWEIAARGPMKLYMADIYLHRARLFFREPVYPWDSPAEDLAAAEALIVSCGYHRRDAELADAKGAILSQV